MPTIDYLPIANGGGANVESQAQYVTDLAGGGSLENGYEAGLAKSVQFNKTMRQSSMIAAALATFISQQLGISVLDDGVLSTLVTNLTNAVRTANQAGQCRLGVVSTTSLKLSPYGGNHLTINGVSQAIPAAGVTITSAGLAANTTYYVYAFMNAGVMTLDINGTGHSTDVATAGNIGVEIMTATPTRTLVGMVRTDASVHFLDNVTNRFCASWFNRLSKQLTVGVSGTTFTNASLAELTTGLRLNFVCWADSPPVVAYGGFLENASASNTLQAQTNVDSIALGNLQSMFISANAADQNFYSPVNDVLTEGFHMATLYADTSGGTATAVQAYGRGNVIC